MKIAKAISSLIESFEKLPGIGPKSAQRLTYYLLHVPQRELDEFGKNLERLKKDTVFCTVCKNIAEVDPCPICSDNLRDKTILLVVEQPLDILAFERSGRFRGIYHCLHGAINPLENIGPDEIFIDELIKRVKDTKKNKIEEVVIATNPTMEGEATAMYLVKQFKSINSKVKVTRLGMGIPTGADLEYADDVTLTQALEGRREM
ncbi:recombination protein RecR [Candidatus Woesebacteria bacterium RIFOXYC1_FULL_31_51]|uniref:Recombination protein RecR n=1 Tax=Candidatus Woesebacteria bacterium GW2011_GWC2_31_9 TaxID=1618586 RepID=A0A0G0BMN4_9BACT|nr:MAG: recombination protein RecR, recombination protein RecR [Candidatus Woesebacteria bacterium GW2011_GWF1_31_35]KKP22791.1 MAG: Recombination protein RecR [Candidatus Woesebacteria bacterium GW2011_GWC1_30_29]KKP26721.1 MAG: Recombination protein RecR [Candidatus Woesebacteria bacterium GW2011_GWD1_31_12]KKP28039.1 MAG: Recombination protein RecR [Candidatus Woesebacteria bacterium GW2011_GWB1_31_29]KKP32292.1 MAG: Recombination protein RecR [Candidatus Woesebacteria bacterium GW2011_GWC2_